MLVAMLATVSIGTAHAQAISATCDGACGILNGVTAIKMFDTVKVTDVHIDSPSAFIGGGFTHGWAWTFTLQVPCSENKVAMKFSDWVGASALQGTIPANSNVQFKTTGDWVSASNAYGATADLTTVPSCDLAAGYTATVTVQAQVPAGSQPGSYASNYGVKTTSTN